MYLIVAQAKLSQPLKSEEVLKRIGRRYMHGPIEVLDSDFGTFAEGRAKEDGEKRYKGFLQITSFNKIRLGRIGVVRRTAYGEETRTYEGIQ